MAKTSTEKKKLLKELTTKLDGLQEQLAEANKKAGLDEYVQIKVKKNQARFDRIKTKDKPDRFEGKFFLLIDIKAKKETVFVPTSISSSRKPTGFMYHIEGTAEGSVSRASVSSRGEGVTQVTVGTLQYTKILAGKTASFRIQIEIKGKSAKIYNIVINRINYKLGLTDTRYQQYIKPIVSDKVKLS